MTDNKITFKKTTKNFAQRKRKLSEEHSSDSASDGETTAATDGDQWQQLNHLKQLQALKKRVTRGVNVVNLANNDTKPVTDTNVGKTAATIKGGITDAKSITNELDLGNTFSVETNRRDEDTDLMKYIDEELGKRKIGRRDANHMLTTSSSDSVVNDKQQHSNVCNNDSISEDALFNILPEHLLRNNLKKNEEMLSNQMLNGIPEVELGIEERIRNIEATEEAKQKLVEKKKNKVASSMSSFVPNNIAVCFVHHNRFNIDDSDTSLRIKSGQKKTRNVEQTAPSFVEEPLVVIGDEPQKSVIKLQSKGSEQSAKFPGKEKASDDYIFEKFKKQFRKF